MNANQMARIACGMDKWPEPAELDLVTTHDVLGKALDAMADPGGYVTDYKESVRLVTRLLEASVRELEHGHYTAAERDRGDAFGLMTGLSVRILDAYEAKHGKEDWCESCVSPLFACRCDEGGEDKCR